MQLIGHKVIVDITEHADSFLEKISCPLSVKGQTGIATDYAADVNCYLVDFGPPIGEWFVAAETLQKTNETLPPA